MYKRLTAAALLILLTACAPEEEERAAMATNVISAPEASETQALPRDRLQTTYDTEISETAAQTAVRTEKVISFTALGDNLIHSSIYNQAARRGAEKGKSYDFEYAYAGVSDLLDDSDITILNQETLICGDDKYEPSTYPCFNSPEELGLYMSELGVDVFTIANNHTLDMGEDGLSSCLDFYDENGLMRVGAYKDTADRENIRVKEINGIAVSFLAYTESLNGLSLSEGTSLEIGRFDLEQIKTEIAAAKEISDICAVSLHWGLENSGETEDYQRSAARELGEAGADIIIGNHPHVLREIEIFENSDGGDTICAYSLGNFISAQSVGKNLIGGILDFEITVPEGGEPEINGWELIPIVTHYDANYSNVRLYTLSDYTPELAAAHGVRANSRFDYGYITEYLESKGLI